MTIRFWEPALALEDRDFPLEVDVTDPGSDDPTAPISAAPLGEFEGYSFAGKSGFRLSVRNNTESDWHVYMLIVMPNGFYEVTPIWPKIYKPLASGEAKQSYHLRFTGPSGLHEIRLLASPRELDALISPPMVGFRSVADPYGADFSGVRAQTFFVDITEPTQHP